MTAGRTYKLKVLPRISDEDWQAVVAEQDGRATRFKGRGGVTLIGHSHPPEDWTAIVDALIERDYLAAQDKPHSAEWIKCRCPACGSSSGFFRRDKAGKYAHNAIRYSCSHRCGGKILAALDIDARSEASAATVLESVPVQPVQPDGPVTLDGVRKWLGRFVSTVQDSDLDLLTLWAAHTHLCVETFTTPRLLLDSPVPGSGKTTTLEHLDKLCLHPVQMATLSSPAMLVRILDTGVRTILIDEADRSLAPDKDGIGDLIAVLNSGYKRGGTRPVLTPAKDGGWNVKEMPTFAPVAMAGNSPNLPEDTRSRAIRVLLMPDVDGSIEDSDWEWIEEEARQLGKQLAAWADQVRDAVRLNRPPLPEQVKGRARERWSPLMRVAEAAGGHWPDVVRRLAVEDVEEQELARGEGAVTQRPHVVLMQHLAEVWPEGETFVPTEDLIDRLVNAHPDTWGEFSSFGKRLTAQRLGRMLSSNYKIHSSRLDARASRGYTLASLSTAFRRFGLTPSNQPAQLAQPAEPAQGRNTCSTCGGDLDGAAFLVGATTCTSCETKELTA